MVRFPKIIESILQKARNAQPGRREEYAAELRRVAKTHDSNAHRVAATQAMVLLFLDEVFTIEQIPHLQALEAKYVRDVIGHTKELDLLLRSKVVDDAFAPGGCTHPNPVISHLWWWYVKKSLDFREIHREEATMLGMRVD